MFINASENITVPYKDSKTFNQNFTLWTAITKKIQYNFTYSGVRGKTTSDSFNNFISWKIGQNFALKVSYNNKFEEGEHSWDSLINLSFAF